MSTNEIKIPSTAFKQRRKFLTVLPVLVIPFLFLFFISLGGGTGAPGIQQIAATGFNTELPGARFDKKSPDRHKVDFYKQADQDSIRRKEYLRQDPYARQISDTSHVGRPDKENAKADDMLKKLEQVRQAIRQPEMGDPAPVPAAVIQHLPSFPIKHRHVELPTERTDDTADNDPQLEKLNGMLDKIIRIQHPEEKDTLSSGLAETATTTSINSLPAVVQEDQVLVAGATIALRLTEAARINGISFPKDQLAYGVVSISNDRMLITINGLRREQSIYSTALQVCDLDGLPGIHIPGSLGRETAKQSVDQSINSMGIVGLDVSPAAQVTNAGVLAARSLLSRKVRLVRVTVRAGYQVLLRSTRSPISIQSADSLTHGAPDSIRMTPDPANFTPFLHRTVRHEKMRLTLQGVYLRDSLLWLSLLLENQSPIGYTSGYIRWFVRDRKQQRRTAIQDIPVKPVYSAPQQVLPGDSSCVMLTGFRPFALPGGKELVLQLAEANGARELVMEIGEKQLLKAKRYVSL